MLNRKNRWFEVVSEYGVYRYSTLAKARVQRLIVGGTIYECWIGGGK